MKKKSFWALTLSVFLLLSYSDFVRADYPDRPINLIVIMGAGGGADLSSRALAKKAEKFLGQPIVPMNKPGASGTLGTGAVAAAKPDGYTIGNTFFSSLTWVPHSFDVPYNTLTDFEYILGYGQYVYGLCVRADSQFKSLKDLIQYAKAHPGKIKYSLSGLGLPNHFSMVHLAKAEGIKWDPVVFKETPAAVAACLGGHVDVVSQNPGDVIPHINAGKLRLLVSFSSKRWEGVPEVPTVRELGYNFEVDSWLAMGTPKGVPMPILDKLRDAFKKAMEDKEFQEIMARIHVPVVYRTPEEYKKLVEIGYKQNEAMFLDLGLHKSQKKK